MRQAAHAGEKAGGEGRVGSGAGTPGKLGLVPLSVPVA